MLQSLVVVVIADSTDSRLLGRFFPFVIAGLSAWEGKSPTARESDGMEPSAASNRDKPFAESSP